MEFEYENEDEKIKITIDAEPGWVGFQIWNGRESCAIALNEDEKIKLIKYLQDSLDSVGK